MNTPSMKEQQQRKIKTQPGFIAALDQSGGSTPKALRAYGIKEGAWSNEEDRRTGSGYSLSGKGQGRDIA